MSIRRSMISRGNVVRVQLRGHHRQPFDATVTGFDGPLVLIEPKVNWATWRRVGMCDIVDRVEPPVRRRRAAA